MDPLLVVVEEGEGRVHVAEAKHGGNVGGDEPRLAGANDDAHLFPWVAIVAGLLLLLLSDKDAAGAIVGAIGLVSAGPQIIQSTRRPKVPAKKKDA